jgi:hypothetical protein
MSRDIARRLILDCYRPGLAQISREWRDQYESLMRDVIAPKSQEEILAACRAGNWMAIVVVRPLADYYFCWYTRCKVHIFCSFEMICLYEMVFCGTGRYSVLNSLRLAPEYMLLNEDRTIWSRTGPHEWREYHNTFTTAFVWRDISFDDQCTTTEIARLLFMMERVDGRTANIYWIPKRPQCNSMWVDTFWVSSVKKGLFSIASTIWDEQLSHDPVDDVRNVHKLIKREYLEGIDYLISKGLTLDKILEIARDEEKYRVILYYTAPDKMVPPLDSGTTGREQVIKRAQSHIYKELP